MVKKKGRSSSSYVYFVAASSAALIVIVLALVLFRFTVLRQEPYTFNGLVYDPVLPAADFTLINQDNQRISLSDFQGKLVMIYFGFTYCPEACPITLGIWNHVHDMLGEDAERVEFVFISVDPERDTPEQLARHLARYNPAFIGLTGTMAEIEDVAADYSVFFERVESEEDDNYYLVNHTTLTFLIDESGQLLLAFPYATPPDAIVADLEYLLR